MIEGPKVLLVLLEPKDKKEKKVNQDHLDLKVKRDQMDQLDHQVKEVGKVPEVQLDPKVKEVHLGSLVHQDLVETQGYLDHQAKMDPQAHKAHQDPRVYKELLASQEYLVLVGCLACLAHLDCVVCRANLDPPDHQVQEYQWPFKVRLTVRSLLTYFHFFLAYSLATVLDCTAIECL